MAPQDSRLTPKTVAIWLGIFMLAALALRIGGNVGASYDEETGRYLYSGNDPYYHDRAVTHIVETGETLMWDDAINYPTGAPNPNPPLFDWTTALDAKVLDMLGAGDAVGLALNLAVAFWGAITIIPVYMIGRDLWTPRVGLWAAFFMAVSAPHIQRGVFGFADHDATTMFWIVLAISFAIKGLKVLDDREYVKDWRHPAALKEGIANSFRHNKQAMLWSALAGVALSATALTWKGYPYVLAVMAVAVGLQLLNDHVKNKDSTALWAFYLLPLFIVTILPMVYYAAFPTFQDTTIWAGIYVLLGVLVVGLILVPTRDLPSILVFPALAIAGTLGLVLMLLVFPNVGQTIFTGLGYFEQTKLYTTIAEAQRSELGRVAASFGFFTFLIAFGGLWYALRKAWKGDAPQTLMVAWTFVALFMAFAASRFVMNAAPVFAILAAAMMPKFTDWLKLDTVRKRFRQQHGQNTFKAGMRSLNSRAVGGGLMVFAFFILPNVWIGVDAAIPCEVDDCRNPDTKRLGAFGIDFDIKENGWLDAFNALAALDTETALEDRPGFIAWWDYGHWATNIGAHPTVADPFQNHYNLAGRFLASESEQEGMAWLTILVLNSDYHRDDRAAYTPAVATVLEGYNSSLLQIGPMRGYDKEYALMSAAVDMGGDDIFGLYDAVTDAAGKRVSYFGVDVRMYPVSAENAGIFYAPAFLANKNPDDFLSYGYRGETLNLQLTQYGEDKNGNSYRLGQSTVTDASGRAYDVYPEGRSTYRALPAGQAPSQTNPGAPVQLGLTPTEAFYDSMYARAFGHQRNGFTPGEGLSHWRVIHESMGETGFQSVELLEYFRGVTVTGVVRDDAGAAVQGAQVTFVDGFGASHDVGTTDASGTYTVLAPFSVDDDLTLSVRIGGMEVANSTAYQFSKQQARFGHSVNDAHLTVQRGALSGHAYRDLDGDGAFGQNDTAIAGATVTLGSMTTTTDGAGMYTFSGLQPGAKSITIKATGYNDATRTAQVPAGETAELDVGLTVKTSQTTFTLQGSGETFGGIPFTVTGPDGFTRSLTSSMNGTVTTALAPGDYAIDLNYQVSQDGVDVTYTANWTGTVAFGGNDVAFSVPVTKS